MQSPARSRTRHSLADTRRPDCIPRLQQQQSSAEGSSPVRKQPRRQSLPARLLAPRAGECNGAVELPQSSSSAAGSVSSAKKIHGDVPDHLSRSQKSFYSCMMKVRSTTCCCALLLYCRLKIHINRTDSLRTSWRLSQQDRRCCPWRVLLTLPQFEAP